MQFLKIRKLSDLELDLESGQSHTGAHIQFRSMQTPNYIEMRKTLWTEVRTDRRVRQRDAQNLNRYNRMFHALVTIVSRKKFCN